MMILKNMFKGEFKDGKRDGLWEEYHANGTISDKGYYKDGKRYGYWEYYHSNGWLWMKRNYKDDNPHGYWEVYWSCDKLTKEAYI